MVHNGLIEAAQQANEEYDAVIADRQRVLDEHDALEDRAEKAERAAADLTDKLALANQRIKELEPLLALVPPLPGPEEEQAPADPNA